MRLPCPALAVAIVAAVTSLALVAGCQVDAADVVRPGPSSAAPKGVSDESQPVSVSLAAPVATCLNAPAGWSRRESLQHGSSDLRPRAVKPWTVPVVGYLDSFTAVCGQTMSVHLSSQDGDTRVRLRALRIGYYRGQGTRLVWQSGAITAHRQRQAVPTGPDRVIAERWPVAATIPVDASWPPGMYVIEIVPLTAAQPSFIPLVVRTSGARSPYLVVVSDLTWLAYNSYGGRSLYFGPGGSHARRVANRSYVASADRPVAGNGLAQMFSMNVPLIRFLSRNGFASDVTTDSSLDATPSQFGGQQTVLIGGHSEYWTKRMYDAAARARDAGTNFGFLGANEVYWQGRIERDKNGREIALTVYRDSKLDLKAAADPSTTTVQWRHAPLLRDPAALVGEGMSLVGVRGPYVVSSTPPWLFTGTKLKAGDVLKLAIGNEGDAQEPPTRNSPANEQVVLRGVVFPTGQSTPFLITAGYYTARVAPASSQPGQPIGSASSTPPARASLPRRPPALQSSGSR